MTIDDLTVYERKTALIVAGIDMEEHHIDNVLVSIEAYKKLGYENIQVRIPLEMKDVKGVDYEIRGSCDPL